MPCSDTSAGPQNILDRAFLKHSVPQGVGSERDRLDVRSRLVYDFGGVPERAVFLSHIEARDSIVDALIKLNKCDDGNFHVMPDCLAPDLAESIFHRILMKKTPKSFEFNNRSVRNDVYHYDLFRRDDKAARRSVHYAVTWCATCMFAGRRLWFYGLASDCGRSFPLMMTTGGINEPKSYRIHLLCDLFDVS